jgi:polysaccharide export outer membrane protein
VTAQGALLSEYVLVAGDTVDVNVFGEPTLTRSVQIRPDGKINMPLVGDVPAAGLTPAQLADKLTQALKTYLRAPQVAVSITGYQRAYAYLVGQVVRPGSVEIQRGATVLEVMGLAGGVTPRAAMRSAVLIRRASGQTVALDLDKLMVRGDRTVNAGVEPGDIIMVPTLQNRVLIFGAVRSPGGYELEDNTRLADAIAIAGGPADRAYTNQVGLIRTGADGKPVVTHVNFDQVVRGNAQQNVALQNGDILYVPPDNRVRWTDVLSYLSGLSVVRGLTR